MENTTEEIINKIKRFLQEKEKLDIETCYFITKRLNHEYWEEIMDDEETPQVEDEFGDFDDIPDSEEEEPEPLDEEIPEEIPPLKINKPVQQKKEPTLIKRPQIKIKGNSL